MIRKEHVFAARFGGDLEFDDFSVLVSAFDDGLVLGVEFEGDIPFGRPGGEEADFLAVVLEEHQLRGFEQIATMILIRQPVEVWPPCGGPAMSRVGVGALDAQNPCRLVGQAE